MWSRGKSENERNILLLFSCLGFTYFGVEAFYVSVERPVFRPASSHSPCGFPARLSVRAFWCTKSTCGCSLSLIFSNVPPASLFCPIKFIFAVCFRLENKLSLLVQFGFVLGFFCFRLQ